MNAISKSSGRVLLLLIVVTVLFGILWYKNYYVPGGRNTPSNTTSVYKLPDSFNKSLQAGPYTCPVANCKNATYQKNGTLVASMALGSPVFAAFGGKAEVLASSRFLENGKTENYSTILLTNEERGLVARYELKGALIEPTAVVGKVPGVTVPPSAIGVKEGDRLSNIAGQLGFANASLVFSVSYMREKGLVAYPLAAKDFK